MKQEQAEAPLALFYVVASSRILNKRERILNHSTRLPAYHWRGRASREFVGGVCKNLNSKTAVGTSESEYRELNGWFAGLSIKNVNRITTL